MSETTNFWRIDHFLEDEKQAQSLLGVLQSLKPEEWMVSVYPNGTNFYTYPNVGQNQPFLECASSKAIEANKRNEFSYLFQRFDGHGQECKCDFCIFVYQTLRSPETLEKISKITGTELKSAISIFGSKYTPGSFLSEHTDTGRGRIAFSLNLTPEWDPETDGGQFQLMDKHTKAVLQKVDPTFNTLVLFDVREYGQPHHVLPVTGRRSRYAITGWFV
jgi:hypothetical protein